MSWRVIIEKVDNGYVVLEGFYGEEPNVSVFQNTEHSGKCKLDSLIEMLYHVADTFESTGRYDNHRIGIVCKPGDKLDEPESCPNRYENQWWGCQGKPTDYLCPKRPPDKNDGGNE